MVTAEKYVINDKGKCMFIKRFPGKAGIYQGENAIRKSFRHAHQYFWRTRRSTFLKRCYSQSRPIDISPALTYVVDLLIIYTSFKTWKSVCYQRTFVFV